MHRVSTHTHGKVETRNVRAAIPTTRVSRSNSRFVSRRTDIRPKRFQMIVNSIYRCIDYDFEEESVILKRRTSELLVTVNMKLTKLKRNNCSENFVYELIEFCTSPVSS